jgi:hypothetical protein
VINVPNSPDDPDRYTARPLGGGDWFVWDTRRHEPVYMMDTLREHQAREAAQRMSQAYRRAMSPVEIPPVTRLRALDQPDQQHRDQARGLSCATCDQSNAQR